jgi:hypothetical protein
MPANRIQAIPAVHLQQVGPLHLRVLGVVAIAASLTTVGRKKGQE